MKYADDALAARGVKLGPEWRRMSVIRLANDDPGQWSWHKFIWREKGGDAYRALVGNALPPPLWEVRYATFDGDVAERAEEWRVTIAADGTARTIRHQLPQAREGARLPREAAEALALQEVKRRFGRDGPQVKQVGAEEEKRQNRTDWSFMFTDPSIDVGAGGELRYVVTISGDEVTGAGRIVHVPEAWVRGERERDNRRQIVRMSAGVLFMIAGFVALILGIMAWTKGRCDTRAVKWVGGVSFVLAIASLANAWPQTAMGLRTTEPVASQYAMLAMGALAGGLVSALLFGVVAGIGAWYARSAPRSPIAGALPPWGAAIAAGLLVSGVQAVAGNLGTPSMPLWPAAWGGALASPLAGALLSGFGFLSAAGIALFILYAVARLTRDWTRHAWLGMALVVVLQCAAVLAQSGGSLGPSLAAGGRRGRHTGSRAVAAASPRCEPRPAVPGDGHRAGDRGPRSAGRLRRPPRRSRRSPPPPPSPWRGSSRATSRRRCPRRPRQPLPSLHLYPVRRDEVVGAVHDGDVAARRPRDHLPVQRQVVDLGVVRRERFPDQPEALFRVHLGARP